MQKKLTGTGVAIITPFKGGRIDFRALEKIIEFHLKHKMDYFVVLGTTGESVTLNKDEKVAVAEFVVETVEGRVPIVLGIGGNNTADILHSFNAFDFSGIDAILSVSPYYNRPTQKGVFEHYRTVANAAPKPVILYNVPSRTSSNITSDTTLKLAHDIRNVVGIKEASGDLAQIARILQDRPRNFLVTSGDDALTLPMIALGADGVISVAANAFPKEMVQMTHNALDGKFKRARTQHLKMLNLFDLLFEEGNPAGVKAALEIQGYCENQLRLPLVGTSRALHNRIEAAISAL